MFESLFEAAKYSVPDSESSAFIKIYYKKMIITWVLQSFSSRDAYELACRIIEKNKNIKYFGLKLLFVCKNKKQVNIIYKELFAEYYSYMKFRDLNNGGA